MQQSMPDLSVKSMQSMSDLSKCVCVHVCACVCAHVFVCSRVCVCVCAPLCMFIAFFIYAVGNMLFGLIIDTYQKLNVC